MSASTDNHGNGTPWLAFLVGGLLVAVAAIGFFVYTGGQLSAASSEPSKIEFNVKSPAKS